MPNGAIPDGDFVRAISELVKQTPQVKEIRNGQLLLTVGEKHTILLEPKLAYPKTLNISTLSGVVDAYRAMHEKPRSTAAAATVEAGPLSGVESVLIHVVSPCCVQIVAPLVGPEKQQFSYVVSQANTPDLDFGAYIPLDEMICMVLAKFADCDERTRLLDHIGSLTAGLYSEIEDDGSSQQVTARKGFLKAGGPARFKNPVYLTPFRTFSEVDQPASAFILRLQQKQQGENLIAFAGLWDADGGAWQAEAIQRVGAYLRNELPDAVILA